MNLLSSINGYLSRINTFSSEIINENPDPDIIVSIGGERFVMGKNEKLMEVNVEYNVRGGGLCTLGWANIQFPRVGAPVNIYIGVIPFWSGIVINGKDRTWQAEPFQGIFNNIYFYDKKYEEFPFAGSIEDLVKTAFEFAQSKYPLLKIGKIVSSSLLVEFDINNSTISDILKFCGEQFENSNSVWGIDNEYNMYFSNIEAGTTYKVNEDSYSGDAEHSIESDNVITVFSVFKTKEVEVTTPTGKDTIYPMQYLGKVGIGDNDIAGGYFPSTKNYFVYGYKEERYEIDAPDLSPTAALQDAYNVLQKTQPTETTKVKSYDYGRFPIPIGSNTVIYTKRQLNLTFSVDVGGIALVPSNSSGAVSVVDDTEVNEGLIEKEDSSFNLSNNPQWQEQIALIDYITELSIGYIATADGFITLQSQDISITQQIKASDIQNFASFTDLNKMSKMDMKIIVTGSVNLVSLYATAHYGQTSYQGYLRAVKLKSSVKGNYYDLTVNNYGALPVLTFQRLQEQIRTVETITLRR